jgi:hypothetical protein
LVSYCGKVKNPGNDEVTTGMIVEVLADQFPEFLMAVAEENWVRGYHQALVDLEASEKTLEKKLMMNILKTLLEIPTRESL